MARLGKRLASGDEAAFVELYDLCADRLHHYLVMRLGSPADAEDVLQETLLRLVRQRSKLAAVENLAAYAFTVARREALRYLEQRGRRQRRTVGLSPEQLFELAGEGPESESESRHVAEALLALEDSQREVVELKIYGALTFAEIAQVMEIPAGTAASWWRLALEKLRRRLEPCSHE